MKNFIAKWSECVIFSIYTICIGTLSLTHSIWRDEGQAWLIARDSSFWSLFSLAKYEGSGMLWHIILYPFAHLGLPVESMQIINFCFAVLAIYSIVRYAPFSIWMKMLIISGYFFIFEYSVIARSYGLSVLLLCSIALIYKTRITKPIRYGIFLGLLMYTNIHSFILVCVLLLSYMHDVYAHRQEFVSHKKRIIVICGICILIGLQTYTLIPPDDLWARTKNTYTSMDIKHITTALQGVTHAFIPIPHETVHFWNSSYVDTYGFGILVALCILLISCIPLRNNRKILIIYIGYASLLLLLFFTKRNQLMRHEGFLYMSWFFALWIARDEKPEENSLTIPYFIFLMHMIGGIVSLGYAYAYPFSKDKDMGTYINTLPDNNPILLYPEWRYQGVLSYIQPKKRYYCVQAQKECSFTTWTTAYDRYVSTDEIKKDLQMFDSAYPDGYYVLSDTLMDTQYTLIYSTSKPCIVSDSCEYFLYKH